ncbi:MAG: FAD-binding oxidoreductase [Fimbriimonadaceae bacterium]|nr:FAD-binding oxidoreductase [Fimbriimonadaceae bacterium]
MSPERWAAVKAEAAAWDVPSSGRFALGGSGTKSHFLPPPVDPVWRLPAPADPIIQWMPDDQVVVAWAGASVADLQAILAEKGQCLPLPQTGHPDVDGRPGTLGGLAAMNLPHGLEAQCGPVRDWILGVVVRLADGSVARAGSTAVKSVAGYDIHRLFAGSRGRLGIVAAVALRTFPIRALPTTSARAEGGSSDRVFICRTPRADFDDFRRRATRVIASDPASATLWLGAEPAGFQGWMIGPNGRLQPRPPEELDRQAKLRFDPEMRLNLHLES